MAVVIKIFTCYCWKIISMTESVKRSISGLIYILLLIACVFYSQLSFQILFGFFMVVAVNEFSKIIDINPSFALYIASAFYIGSLFFESEETNLFIGLFSVITGIYLLYFIFTTKVPTFSTIQKYILLLGYLVFSFIIITKIPLGLNGYNPKILFGIFILIWTNDTFAYLVGKNFGKRKLFPSISPKKTIEGFLGGLIFTVIAGYFIATLFIQAKIVYIWLIIAIIVSIYSTLGDLVESKFKRLANVKDSGTIMPGHGGILDRLDSIIFVSPFIYMFFLILNLLSNYVS